MRLQAVLLALRSPPLRETMATVPPSSDQAEVASPTLTTPGNDYILPKRSIGFCHFPPALPSFIRESMSSTVTSALISSGCNLTEKCLSSIAINETIPSESHSCRSSSLVSGFRVPGSMSSASAIKDSFSSRFNLTPPLALGYHSTIQPAQE